MHSSYMWIIQHQQNQSIQIQMNIANMADL